MFSHAQHQVVLPEGTRCASFLFLFCVLPLPLVQGLPLLPTLLCSAVPVSSVKVQVNGLSPKHDEKVPILDIAGGFRKRKNSGMNFAGVESVEERRPLGGGGVSKSDPVIWT